MTGVRERGAKEGAEVDQVQTEIAGCPRSPRASGVCHRNQ
jgi:hypothetical protein